MSRRTDIPPGSVTFDAAEGSFYFKCPGCGVLGELVPTTADGEDVGHVVTLNGDGTATVEPSIVCPACDWHDRAERVAVVS